MRDDGLVSVDMGIPRFEEPFEFALKIEGKDITMSGLILGNPHAVLRVADTKTAAVELWGPSVQRHPHFPNRCNVGFMQILDRNHILLRVFERGAGETQACGTGACAAVAAGVRQGLLDAEVRVDLPGGMAMVFWEGPGQHIWLTGPATTVFTGSIDLTRFTGAKQ